MTTGMRRISSSMTYFSKTIFPIFWFGIAGVMAFSLLAQRPLMWQPLIAAAAMILFGLAMFRSYVWDLADEVFDGGDKLIVHKGEIQQTVMLRDIVKVRVTRNSNPTRLTLVLRAPGKLGDKIVFSPPISDSSWIPFARHPLAKELEDRIALLKKESTRPS